MLLPPWSVAVGRRGSACCPFVAGAPVPCRAPLRGVALQTDPSAIEAAVVVHESALIDALATLFDGLWRRALPLPGPSVAGGTTRPHHNPDVDEQLLRALLLSGPTDTAIARPLVAVHRTLQRRVAYARPRRT